MYSRKQRKLSWPSSHFDGLRSRWSRKLLMRRSWDWIFSPTPKREVKSTDLTKTRLPYDEERTWSHEKRCVGIITSSTLGTITPLSCINSNQFWVYVGMEITSSRIRQWPRKVSTISPTRYLRVYSATIKSKSLNKNDQLEIFVIRHFKFIWRRQG